jgi:hypothetical protein
MKVCRRAPANGTGFAKNGKMREVALARDEAPKRILIPAGRRRMAAA